MSCVKRRGILSAGFTILIVATALHLASALSNTIGEVDPVPATIQETFPPVPRWDNTPCPGGPTPPPNVMQETSQGCALQAPGTVPNLIYGDSPEAWNQTSWTTINPTTGQPNNPVAVNLELGSGGLSPGTFVYFFYENTFDVPAHFRLTIAGPPGTQVQFFQSVSNVAHPTTLEGAKKATLFLQDYLNGGPFLNTTLPSSGLGVNVITRLVQPNSVIQGEGFYLSGSQVISLELNADICSSPCQQGTVDNPVVTAAADTHNRSGQFNSSIFILPHDQTTKLSHANQQTYLDVVKPESAIPGLYNGEDFLRGLGYQMNTGDYGAIVHITGTNPNAALKQRWHVEARTGRTNNYAFYISGMANDTSPAPTGQYPIPSSGRLATQADGGYLGTSLPGVSRDLYFIPSGDDTFPMRLYYVVQ